MADPAEGPADRKEGEGAGAGAGAELADHLEERRDARVPLRVEGVSEAAGYLPAAFKAEILASTKLAGAGETVEVTFTVPATAGNYPYVCTFPAHFAGGMKGTLVVKAAGGAKVRGEGSRALAEGSKVRRREEAGRRGAGNGKREEG